MYIKYHIIKMERKTTSTGKMKIDADLQDFNGLISDRVTIWQTFPNFAALNIGDEVIGQITVKQNGQYTNKTLNEERTTGHGARPNISAMMEKKAENIAVAQERKNDSIAFFNATNSAIAMVVKTDATLEFSEDLQKKIVAWRNWFLAEWQRYDADPTKGKQPF